SVGTRVTLDTATDSPAPSSTGPAVGLFTTRLTSGHSAVVVEGATTTSFTALLHVVEGMADTTGSPVARLEAAVGALMRAVDATTGLLLHGGPDGMDVRAVGPPATPEADRPLPPAVRIVAGDQPLIDPVL